MESKTVTIGKLEASPYKNGIGIFEPDGNGGESLLAYIKNDESDKEAKAERIVHCVNSYDELVKQNKMLKQALNTILNLGRPNGDYAAAFSKTKTIANNALNTLTVKEDGNNEAKAL